ncbi:hypothetical protein [Pseudoalteromonas rubra]|uniref:hypothetical protein n=1 Tax=Pseudoalteromonas rubra TaxID=43658 RepID=UPI002DB99727|nr:hypothetical protein [Pseudoalteromonas rubra]MEC4091595.1 hypothetical protein [Pseudoalteromonas rubra]
MFLYETEFERWGAWVRDTDVSIHASQWEFIDKTQKQAAGLYTHETEQAIEDAVSGMLRRGDELAAQVLRQYYVYAQPKEKQAKQAKKLGISLYTFKNKLRKGRKRVALSVFGHPGYITKEEKEKMLKELKG